MNHLITFKKIKNSENVYSVIYQERAIATIQKFDSASRSYWGLSDLNGKALRSKEDRTRIQAVISAIEIGQLPMPSDQWHF